MSRNKIHLFSGLLIIFAVTAQAQNRVFVSAAHGDDLNACSVTAPCRSFAHAITVVAAGGEILALDSGGYGPVTIAQSVSIISPLGVEGSITQNTSGQNAINVNAAGANVTLRGLSIFGLGTGASGISIGSADTIAVESCRIDGFAQWGIIFSVSTLSTLTVSNCTIAHNSITGITTAASTSNAAQFEIDHTHLEANVGGGLSCYEGSFGIIRDSYVSGSQFGISAQDEGASGQTTLVEVENCTVTFSSGVAIDAATNGGTLATIRVSNSVIALNQTGVFAVDANAHIWTRGNNTLANNVSPGAFTDTFTGQ